MTDIIEKLVMYGLKKSIRSRAKVDAKGISGSVGIAICAVPLIVSILLGAFSYNAIHDPDPADKNAGYFIAALTVCTLFVFIHFVSYRIWITERSIISKSLILGERVIQLSDPFELHQNEDSQELFLKQKRTRIKIDWTLNGYNDFNRMLIEIYQHQTTTDED